MRTGAADLPWWRVLLAFALAPAVASLAEAVVQPMYEGLPSFAERVLRTFRAVAIVGGYPPTLVLGIPLFLVLRHRVRATYLACALAGAGVAVVPWLLIALLTNDGDAGMNGRATVIDGHMTSYGVWMGLRMAAEIGAFGAIGGLVFRLVAGRGKDRAKSST